MFALACTQRSVHKGIWIKPRTTDLYRDVMNWTPNDWYENIRMSQQSFNHICDQLSVFIERMTTKFRSPHPVGKRVMVKLLRLATNIEFRTLGHLFGMGRSTAWKHHDAHVLRESSVFLKASAGELLPNWTENLDNVEVPPFIIGDPAYPSLTWLMKAYPGNNLSQEQQVFNCRLSRARMTIECAFGRLKGRWRCLIKRLDNELYSVSGLAKACCTLHNICEVHGYFFNENWLEDIDDNVTTANNTKKKMRLAINVFRKWQLERNELAKRDENISCIAPDIEEMTKDELCYSLSRFICEVIKENGEDYPGQTLYEILINIQMHF
ncbi:unnamed protein product [Mytilus edulis]|uniref:DDE Tnp4 domain-containing protein n=1 Tax=Mytilus edulis TaxID=6550 RepID=A0A8S3T9K1_MYTED|nr:unnamed protein product [Mytilus edulis]